jgi:hypothetical protein
MNAGGIREIAGPAGALSGDREFLYGDLAQDIILESNPETHSVRAFVPHGFIAVQLTAVSKGRLGR